MTPPAGWWEDGEWIDDLSGWADDDPRWDEPPACRPVDDLAAEGDLLRKRLREGA